MFLLAGQGGEKLDVARTPETKRQGYIHTYIHICICTYTGEYMLICVERERERERKER